MASQKKAVLVELDTAVLEEIDDFRREQKLIPPRVDVIRLAVRQLLDRAKAERQAEEHAAAS